MRQNFSSLRMRNSTTLFIQNGTVQEIKNTARLPGPEAGGELVGGAATGWHCHATSLPNKCLEVMAGTGEPAVPAMAYL